MAPHRDRMHSNQDEKGEMELGGHMDTFITKLIQRLVYSVLGGTSDDFNGAVSIIGLSIYVLPLFRRWKRFK